MTPNNCQHLIDRCNSLFNQEVIVSDHPNWRIYQKAWSGQQKRLLTGRIIGWSWEIEDEDEPQLQIRYASDLPESWANQIDDVLLSQVELINQPTAIANCQRLFCQTA
jgi:hypothetical protein